MANDPQLTCYGIGKAIYNLYFHPLCKFPGPKIWAASATPGALSIFSGKAHEKILSLHTQYGDVVRVGPNALSFTHPEAWREVCGHLKQGQAENGKDPKYLNEEFDKSLISASRERHGPMRRAMAHGFSARAMAEQQPMINAYIDAFMTALRKCGEDGMRPLNLTEWYEWTTFDIIGDLSFGESFGCLKNHKSHPWVEMLFSTLAAIPLVQALKDLPFFKLLAPLYFITMMPSDSLKNQAIVGKFAEESIKKRLSLPIDRPDFVQAMLKKNPDYEMNEREITDTCSVLVGAGSETTATTLAAATYFICAHPQVMKKLNTEVRLAYKTEEEITIQSVGNLTYMLAVLKETMRIYPPVPIALARITPPSGSLVVGRHIEGGTTLNLWQYAMYHKESNFCQPESFIPNRWLGDERFDSDQKEIHQPFSLGPRNCLGMNLAYIEMRLILARIIWNFDMELDPDSQDWTKGQSVFFFWKKPDLNVRLKPRSR
ncbi:cytochrome P450 [Amylocarpus encephaloides]|uniref:Cytochrome P450 n=1 Tax=Amylocarpus encephaloides TaxID=45428 RepID=A0A9P7YDK3_9HELO|nr:cytochrome P450 [Amylocarpus encephaloides]